MTDTPTPATPDGRPIWQNAWNAKPRRILAAWNTRVSTPPADNGLLPGLDHIANFLNALDTEGMTANEVRSAVYSECLEPGCKAALSMKDEGR